MAMADDESVDDSVAQLQEVWLLVECSPGELSCMVEALRQLGLQHMVRIRVLEELELPGQEELSVGSSATVIRGPPRRDL